MKFTISCFLTIQMLHTKLHMYIPEPEDQELQLIWIVKFCIITIYRNLSKFVCLLVCFSEGFIMHFLLLVPHTSSLHSVVDLGWNLSSVSFNCHKRQLNRESNLNQMLDPHTHYTGVASVQVVQSSNFNSIAKSMILQWNCKSWSHKALRVCTMKICRLWQNKFML